MPKNSLVAVKFESRRWHPCVQGAGEAANSSQVVGAETPFLSSTASLQNITIGPRPADRHRRVAWRPAHVQGMNLSLMSLAPYAVRSSSTPARCTSAGAAIRSGPRPEFRCWPEAVLSTVYSAFPAPAFW